MNGLRKNKILKFLKKALILLICFKISQIDVVASNIINDNMLPPSYSQIMSEKADNSTTGVETSATTIDEIIGDTTVTEEILNEESLDEEISLEEIPTTIETSATISTDEENQAVSQPQDNSNNQNSTAPVPYADGSSNSAPVPYSTTDANISNNSNNANDDENNNIPQDIVPTEDNNNDNENQSEEETEPQGNTSKLKQYVSMFGIGALLLFAIASDIFMTSRTGEMLELPAYLNDTKTLKEFYYIEYEKYTEKNESNSNNRHRGNYSSINPIEDNISGIYLDDLLNLASPFVIKIFNLMMVNANSLLVSSNSHLIGNYISTLINNTTIPTLIKKPIVFVVKQALSIGSTIFNLNIIKYNNILSAATESEVVSEEECNKINKSENSNEWCEKEYVYPFQRANGISITILIARILTTIGAYAYYKDSPNSDYGVALNIYATQVFLDFFMNLTSGAISRSSFFDKNYICEKSFATNYESFANQTNRDCEQFTEKLNMNNPKFDNIIAYSVLDAIPFLISFIMVFVCSYFAEENE